MKTESPNMQGEKKFDFFDFLYRWGTIITIVLLIIFFSVKTKSFLSTKNIINILRSISIVTVIAIGVSTFMVNTLLDTTMTDSEHRKQFTGRLEETIRDVMRLFVEKWKKRWGKKVSEVTARYDGFAEGYLSDVLADTAGEYPRPEGIGA